VLVKVVVRDPEVDVITVVLPLPLAALPIASVALEMRLLTSLTTDESAEEAEERAPEASLAMLLAADVMDALAADVALAIAEEADDAEEAADAADSEAADAEDAAEDADAADSEAADAAAEDADAAAEEAAASLQGSKGSEGKVKLQLGLWQTATAARHTNEHSPRPVRSAQLPHSWAKAAEARPKAVMIMEVFILVVIC
jgi:hypothetical protein